MNGHIDVVCALVEAGATVDYVANDGTTPLSIADQNGHVNVAELLRLAIAKKSQLIPALMERVSQKKDEKNAIGATFFFNIMHYALRPWPWIIVALASIIVFPDLASIKEAFPNISDDKLGNDLAYPAMLTMLPSGLLGLVIASLVAAYMSTISTHLNWGSSYIVNDFYKQQINSKAKERELVNIGRLSTVLLFILSAIFALVLTNALQLFDVILMFGAGTGLIFILRWFWWRINAWSEISAIFVSGIVSILFNMQIISDVLFGENALMPEYMKFPLVVIITTIIWMLVTFATPPENKEVLFNFYKKITPGGPGWKAVVGNNQIEKSQWSVPSGILAMILALIMIYSLLFATGYFIYGNSQLGIILTAIAVINFFIYNWSIETIDYFFSFFYILLIYISSYLFLSFEKLKKSFLAK